MANDCEYTMMVVSRKKDAIDRLFRIMNYEDDEYYIYRVFYVDRCETKKDGKFYCAKFFGDVAWSASSWFDTIEDVKNKRENGAHYVSLDILCKKLKLGVEVYTEEEGVGFQEWYRCRSNGEIDAREVVEFSRIYEDEDGNELEEPIDEGGFYDYCVFSNPDEIY